MADTALPAAATNQDAAARPYHRREARQSAGGPPDTVPSGTGPVSDGLAAGAAVGEAAAAGVVADGAVEADAVAGAVAGEDGEGRRDAASSVPAATAAATASPQEMKVLPPQPSSEPTA
ncbi:hypothetical protein GCM10023085_38050 [Actinomadura viridis]